MLQASTQPAVLQVPSLLTHQSYGQKFGLSDASPRGILQHNWLLSDTGQSKAAKSVCQAFYNMCATQSAFASHGRGKSSKQCISPREKNRVSYMQHAAVLRLGKHYLIGIKS